MKHAHYGLKRLFIVGLAAGSFMAGIGLLAAEPPSKVPAPPGITLGAMAAVPDICQAPLFSRLSWCLYGK